MEEFANAAFQESRITSSLNEAVIRYWLAKLSLDIVIFIITQSLTFLLEEGYREDSFKATLTIPEASRLLYVGKSSCGM